MRLLLGLLFVSLVIGATTYVTQERISLTTGETVPTVNTYRVADFQILPDDPDTSQDDGVLRIQLIGVERRVGVTCVYTAQTTPTGTFLINALNKANLSSTYAANATTGSLVQRIFHRLVVMNEAPAVCGRALTGTLTGVPQ